MGLETIQLNSDVCALRRRWIPHQPGKDGKALRNVQSFDLHLASDNSNVTDLAEHLYDIAIQRRGKRAPKFYAVKAAIVAVLLNLHSAYRSDPQRYVRYSRDPKQYTHGRYNSSRVTWKKLDRVLCNLGTAGLIESHIGIRDESRSFDEGRQTRMRATEALADLMLVYGMDGCASYWRDDETIIRKGGKRKTKAQDGSKITLPATRVDYADTKSTRQWRANLEKINKRLATVRIGINLTEVQLHNMNAALEKRDDRSHINFQNKRLRRIFNNNSWEHGGRFYHGWWQQIPSEYRRLITIDGNPTVEIDFTGIHFYILYSHVRLCSPKDPYALPGTAPDERKVVKLAAACLLNAEGKQDAVKALRYHGRSHPMPAKYPTAESLIDALAKWHAPVSDLFGSDEGLKAQFTDSQIAERVMLTMDAEGIPVLPVHDSFIVTAQHADRLETAMLKAFEAVTKGPCPAKLKRPVRWVGDSSGSLADDYFGDDAPVAYGC